MKKWFYTSVLVSVVCPALAQSTRLQGVIRDRSNGEPLPGATIAAGVHKTTTKADGRFSVLADSLPVPVIISMIGYRPDTILVRDASQSLAVSLIAQSGMMSDVVVTGTMKAVSKMASPVPVEVYTPQFFRRNPTPSIFDALQQVNGVRPQLNCNICNTGDIHINGLEGPYTMVLIDGMPIVSSLSSVYGLSGIPNSLVERIEVVKGPASSLYGSEAIGGLINVITKNPLKAPLVAVDVSGTTWGEYNVDAAVKFKPGRKVTSLLGVNYFNFTNRVDKNDDGFTDVTLQNRISLFNKYSFQRKEGRAANIAVRYVYEDRWGGDMRWTKFFRGGDSLYAESIYTSRVEVIGNYQLPVKEKLLFSYSFNRHTQRSVYGTTAFNANQKVGFGQLTWDKTLGAHDLLAGAVLRYTYYDDNTVATEDSLANRNKPERTALPGILVQDEIKLDTRSNLLLGARWDYHPVHGHIFTPRAAWKYSATPNDVIRVNAGTGFRVVNLFTEDHAALTGARKVVVDGELKPERSYNVNVNYVKKMAVGSGWVNVDASVWYTYFTNRILPSYKPDTIEYHNLTGYSVSQGASVNVEFAFTNSLRGHIGATWQDVIIANKDSLGVKTRTQQILTEKWSGNWSLSYTLPRAGWVIDYTGNIYGPMGLPLTSDKDPRPDRSPVWSIQNIQLTKKLGHGMEIYGGIKNLLNWTPAKNVPFLIARANDPFDKRPDVDNPYNLTFDPNYVYAPNQGMRGFLGFRLTMN
ncbi:TonB-dependent receptor [Paraflavitalea pollutisoli]|uniref:TonB-dependent receptor n=1 Tax=Paraflavitalea pollutisoli TaxID=3034143 RepID=UPI0023EBEB68|nr:TonB-dependent receptor [Paraflavitalea sp. H1-2-19X]